MKMCVCVLSLILCLTAMPTFAEQAVDGVKPLICASVQAVNCEPGEDCERGLPESIGAPQFLRIDFAKKEIVGPLRTTTIRSTETSDAQIILQGVELGMGWTIVLDRETGKMTMTLTGRGEGFVVFGACTSP